MFQFPRFPPPHSWSVTCRQVGLPHSDSLGSLVASTSPRHFAAWPRPSSAESAKASTMCSSLTMSVFLLVFYVCYGARGDTSVSPRSQIRSIHLHCQCASHTSPGVEPRGFEPRTSAVQGRRSPRLSYGPLCSPDCHPICMGWARLDSNQGPRPYQGRALTD